MPSNQRKSKSKRKKPKMATPKRTSNSPHSKKAVKTKAPKKSVKKQLMSAAQLLESSRSRQGAVSARQSGDLQGLSWAAQADSESVNELVEEGKLFEAGAVAGVQQADNADESEVHTHEVPEDDVPEEYRDKD